MAKLILMTIMLKRSRFTFPWVWLLALGLPLWCSGQEPRPNPPPTRVYRDRVEPHWFANNEKFWYRVATGNRRYEFVVVDESRRAAFDHAKVAQALRQRLGKEVNPDQLPVETIEFTDDGKSVRLKGKSAAWQCDLETYQLSDAKADPQADEDGGEPRERRRRRGDAGVSTRSPDEKWEIKVRGHNLFLRDPKTDKEEQLTFDGNPGNTYEKDVERDRGVGMRYDAPDINPPVPEVYWAPDSSRFAAMRTKPGIQRRVYLIDSSPQDQLQPKLDSYPYLKPGDEIPITKPRLFEVESRHEIPLDDRLYENPWSIDDVRWATNSSRFTFLFNQRGHQALRILAVDAKSGEVKPVVNEESGTFVDYSGKFFCEYLDKTDEIIWMSERDGWNHLYLYDARKGRVKNQITKGRWVVRGVERVDREKRQIWFRAGGIRPEQDPYYIHYCRVNFDGSGLTILTEGDGTHFAKFSPDQRRFIDVWSRVDLPPVNELRRSDDGKLICKLEEADIHELLADGWKPPERFVAKGRDGSTDIYGIIHRPRNFNPDKKYPVIESIYAGPHDSFTPKSFRANYGQEKLLKRGFIVVQMDGMGTSNRSKKFHDYCWKNIADAGFPDRIAWIKAAAAKYPYMDATRVGIYGTSAGGQNALTGLLTHGDFYKVGVSDCGCHDNRMDKIWWNEQWMGWPVGPHYADQSNVTLAKHLTGKLLLLVGEMDKNVDPASTMQVVNALIKADKDFDFLMVPGAGHGVLRIPYVWRKAEAFFVKHLQPEADAGAAPNASGESQ